MSNQPPPPPSGWEPPPGGPAGGPPQYGQPGPGQPGFGQQGFGQPGYQAGYQQGYQQPGGFAPGIGQFGPQIAFADFGTRFLALLIDSLLASLLMVLAYIPGILGFVVAPKEPQTTTTSDGEVAIVNVPTGTGWLFIAIGGLLSLVLLLVVLYLYYIKPIGRTGQTFGKKAMKIRVVDPATMGPIGTGRSVGRYLSQSFLSGSVCYLGYFWMLWNDRSQTWHDMLANSIVIKT